MWPGASQQDATQQMPRWKGAAGESARLSASSCRVHPPKQHKSSLPDRSPGPSRTRHPQHHRCCHLTAQARVFSGLFQDNQYMQPPFVGAGCLGAGKKKLLSSPPPSEDELEEISDDAQLKKLNCKSEFKAEPVRRHLRTTCQAQRNARKSFQTGTSGRELANRPAPPGELPGLLLPRRPRHPRGKERQSKARAREEKQRRGKC